MAGENVDNYFEQPNGGATDNALNLKGTVKGKDGQQAANVADATDLATTQALANALKDALINIGVMQPDP